MPNFRLVSALGMALAASLALASSPVGNWKGKISVVLPPMPASVTPAQKQMVTKMMDQLAKAQIAASFKKDGSFLMKASGMPGPKPNDQKTGKWTQKGSAVTIVDSGPKSQPETFTLSADGKTLWMAMPGGRGKITFTKVG